MIFRSDYSDELAEELHAREAAGLERTAAAKPEALDPRWDFSTNDYFGLTRSPAVIAAGAAQARLFGSGSRASRLISGTLPCHEDLEEALARSFGSPAALVCGTGYLANLAAVSALAGRTDSVFVDRQAHASLIDGAVLSRARLRRFRHNDMDHLQMLLQAAGQSRAARQRFVIVTESVFGMDGDRAPLAELSELAMRHGAMLIVDEAHALGVCGDNGRGLLPDASGDVVRSGTLSKSLASYGGLLLCSTLQRRYFVNRARPFIFNTALPPSAAGSAREALRILEHSPNLGAIVLERATLLRTLLRDGGAKVINGDTQIVPVLVPGNHKVMRVAERLAALGAQVAAIRSPTVAAGTERVRFSVTLAHDVAAIEATASSFLGVLREEEVL